MYKDLKRATFAIISHPDAGKTTMTEKLLWFGQVIREIGKVKSKQGTFTKSDWMSIEKERGISISSSVMTFPYKDRLINLLDTPGHKDFSEDTYRTLTAVESVLMMIDSAKGVEEQTQKLMDVCRMRDTPIVTFMNKFDRDSMDPFELMDDVETKCSIQCIPQTWPIGDGVSFKGVYNISNKTIYSFKESSDPFSPHIIDASDLDSTAVLEYIGEELLTKLKEDLEMLEGLIPPLDKNEYLAGIQTPVFFGSALNNFGVKEVIESISINAPGPLEKSVLLPPYKSDSDKKVLIPNDPIFSGFIFKIQANMDKRHRDRIAFLRVCSGVFSKGNKLFHVRTGKDIKIATPLMFQANDREIVDTVYPGDIIGLHDTGKYQIGDTFTSGEQFQFTGIPSFAPELFRRVILKDPLKGKQLEKGLIQLSEEGTVQLFSKKYTNEKILGAVGALQFEVVKARLNEEYNVGGEFESVILDGVRWVTFPDEKTEKDFIDRYSNNIVLDHKKRLCFSYKTAWDLNLASEKFPEVIFYKNSDYKI